MFKTDWEERLSEFLNEAIEHPEEEAAICEELIEYVLSLVRLDRMEMTDALLEKVAEMFQGYDYVDKLLEDVKP